MAQLSILIPAGPTASFSHPNPSPFNPKAQPISPIFFPKSSTYFSPSRFTVETGGGFTLDLAWRNNAGDGGARWGGAGSDGSWRRIRRGRRWMATMAEEEEGGKRGGDNSERGSWGLRRRMEATATGSRRSRRRKGGGEEDNGEVWQGEEGVGATVATLAAAARGGVRRRWRRKGRTVVALGNKAERRMAVAEGYGDGWLEQWRERGTQGRWCRDADGGAEERGRGKEGGDDGRGSSRRWRENRDGWDDDERKRKRGGGGGATEARRWEEKRTATAAEKEGDRC